MRYNKFLIVFSLCQCLNIAVQATDKKPTIEKQPGWITVTKIDYSKTNLDDEAEDGYSDLNYEQQVSLEQQAVFCKKAFHILSEAGVQNQSQISVEFDPSFQHLSFHSIKIIRGSQVIDQLKLSNIKTIQQEKDLDRFLYNGNLTAVLFLEDIRKDDIIEYSYTLKGFNPIFKNKYADVFLTQFSVPVYNVFYKLVIPKGRNVIVKNTLTDLQPVIEPLENSISYEWRLQNTKAVYLDNNVPSWYDCYPAIMVSEFNSWKEVIDWAAELFPFTTPLSGSMKKKADDIKATFKTSEQQLMAALRFVQDDVRYMGIEMGENSHKPHAPAQVLAQRFGDCKDKAYLLCLLLKALNIEAWPVLNNTNYKKTITTWLPTPHAFDHATVCVKFNNKTYWFDATINYQRGPLQTISYPDYQTGLVIQPGGSTLTTIPLQETGKVATKETFYVKSMYEPVRLVVTTTWSGSFADDTRNSFKNSSVNEIKKEFKEMYSSYFKKIEADSLTFIDDEVSGLFKAKEYYTIRDFWKEEKGKTQILLEPYFLNGIIKKPNDEKRTMPFNLKYPASYEEEIEIHLPEDWPSDEGKFKFNATSFAFNYEYSMPARNILLLRYNYENKADHVAASETSVYLEEMEDAEKTMAFELSNGDKKYSSSPFKSSSTNGFTAAYVVLGIFALATYFYRRNRRANEW